jgi:peptidyl-prolyl cis-trans isomerase C
MVLLGRAVRGIALVMAMTSHMAGSAAAFDPAQVVASVNGAPITLGDVAVAAERLPEHFRAQPPAVLFPAVVEQLIRQAALAQQAEAAIGPKDELVIAHGRRSYLAETALRRAMAEAVTEEALRAAYDARYKNAENDKEYNAAHIIVPTESDAQRIAREIAEGADFADLARRHSTDGAAASGGSLGWFGRGVMVPEFEAAVTALSPGEVSGPVRTQFGWHLVKLNETRIATIPDFETVRGELATELENGAIAEAIARAAEMAEITRSYEGLDPAFLAGPDPFDN